MNKKYELTLVLDTNFSSAQISETKKKIEERVGEWSILATDDIGLLNLAYPISWQNQAYYLSYCLSLDAGSMVLIESELRILKWIVKFFFYSIADSSEFTKFYDMQKKVLESFPEEPENLEEEINDDEVVVSDSVE